MNWETSQNKTLVIAHRGDTKTATENTLPAVESALRMGVDGVEVDLQITQDQNVVVFHDQDLSRLAGIKKKIKNCSWKELQEISLKDGSKIPTLEDLLDFVQGRLLINLELKVFSGYLPSYEGQLVKRVGEILKNYPHKETLLFSSFHPFVLRRIQQLLPTIKTGYLFDRYSLLHRFLISKINPFSIHPSLSYFFKDPLQKPKRRTFVWTVNNEDDMKMCIEQGANGLITDEARKLLALLGQQK